MKGNGNPLLLCVLLTLDSVAKVVGMRTLDQRVWSLNLDSGLIFRCRC